MRVRFLDRFRPSPRTQRRLEHWGATVRNVVSYPVQLVFSLFRVIGRTLAGWWESRNLRYLLQGLPSLFLAIGIVVLGAVMFFQDKALLANQYQFQGQRSLAEADQ